MEVLMHQGNCEYMTLYHRVIDSFFLSNTHFILTFMMQIFFTFWQGFLIEVLHSFGVIGEIGDWDSEHVVDGLQVSLSTT